MSLGITVASCISILSGAFQRILKPLAILPFSSVTVAMASGTGEASRVTANYLKTFFGFCISGAFMVISVKIGVALINGGLIVFNYKSMDITSKLLYITVQNAITPIVISGLVKANHISIEEMHDIERNSKDLDEFRILAKEKISSVRSDGSMKKIAVEQEFIEHLKAENALLNERLYSVMREINQCRMEQQNMLEMSMSNKKASMDYKLEAERLKKESLRNKSELTMAEKKSVIAQEMIRRLNALNDRLISEKAEREGMAGKLQSELDSVKEDYLCKEAENEVLKRQIKLLEQQKADVQMSNLGKHNDASEGEADSYEEDPAFLAQPADRGSLEDGYYEETAIDEEIDELDYSPEDLIPIENRKKEVVRHSNFFSQIVSRYFENKFCKKSQAEQDNLIFIKLMENEFSKDMVYLVKKALNENNSMSRLELYKLIINRADDGDIIRFCSAE